MPVIYRLLGDLVVGSEDQPIALPSGHRLTVLGVLLLNANRQVSTADLLRAGWGDTRVGDTQLHKCVSSLRRLLDQVERRGDLVTHPGSGYEMRVAEEDLDALLFHGLVRRAEDAGAHRRTPDEVDLLRRALRLWRGRHPLANVASEGFRRDTEELEQRRKRAAVRLFELEIGHRHYDRIAAELHTVAGYYPTDRRLCAQLMVVLYRNGHATEAVTAYHRYAAALADEIGGEPDPQLRHLCLAIARDDEPEVAKAEAAMAARTATPAQSRDVPRQLPPGTAALVGRDEQVAEVRRLLDADARAAVAVVVVPGPGGIGKTALALHVAHQLRDRYPDGQLYAELRGSTNQPLDAGEVLAQFLRGFGVSVIPEAAAERTAMYRSVVADRRVLVVLDDARDEAQVRDLVPGSASCAVLVTARRRLPGIDGVHHVPALEPLDAADAATLFLDTLARAGIDRRAEPRATARVVALCAGLPLALCIAAALRVRDFGQPTAELAKRLAGQRPDAFEYGERSVGRTIGAGLDRLDDAARRLFLGLGLVDVPEFGLWTAAAVLDDGADPADGGADPAEALLRLASSYMIQPAGSGLRYRFHDLTGEYARGRARQDYPAADRAALPGRVYGALLTLTRHAHRALYGGDYEVVHSQAADWPAPPAVLTGIDQAPLAWYEAQRWNIRAAVNDCADLGLTDLCWDLAVSAHEFYTVAGYFDDWHVTHTRALRACRESGDRHGEGVVLAILGQPALVASRATGVTDVDGLKRAADLLGECGDRHGRAIAQRTLANALRRQGQLGRPLTLFGEALEGYAASGDAVGRWQTLRFIGQTHLDLGDLDEALRVLLAAQAAARELAKPRLGAQTSYWLGQAHLARGELAEARAAFTAVLEVFGDPAGVGHAYATHGLGDVAGLAGRFIEGERLLGTAVRLAAEAADAVLEGRVLLSIAALREARGRPHEQLAALTRAVECFTGCGAVYLEVRALAALATAHAAHADVLVAEATWDRIDARYEALAVPDADRQFRRPIRMVSTARTVRSS
jgi:DNA-binding SARP family transcriptional activator/tetratricopeptide (TPR) repeat protein